MQFLLWRLRHNRAEKFSGRAAVLPVKNCFLLFPRRFQVAANPAVICISD
jgi:hypothetical protein